METLGFAYSSNILFDNSEAKITKTGIYTYKSVSYEESTYRRLCTIYFLIWSLFPNFSGTKSLNRRTVLLDPINNILYACAFEEQRWVM